MIAIDDHGRVSPRSSTEQHQPIAYYESTGHYHEEAIQDNRPFVSKIVQRYPVAVLASAAVVGVSLGWLVKRRK